MLMVFAVKNLQSADWVGHFLQRLRKCSFHVVRASFLKIKGSFSLDKHDNLLMCDAVRIMNLYRMVGE